MGQIIAVVSGKGGTGKTTLTSCVGIALADMGYRTLVLDCDICLRNLDIVLGLSEQAMMDFSDVLEGRCSLKDAVVTHKDFPKLDFLTAPSYGGNERVSVSDTTRLRWEITEKYDYCLVDAPAGIGPGFQMAIQLADRVAVISTPDATALRDAQRVVMELQGFKDANAHLVMNRVDKKSTKTLLNNVDDAMDYVGLPLLGIVPEDEKIPMVLNRGLPLKYYDYTAAHAFENIASRIIGKNIPVEKI